MDIEALTLTEAGELLRDRKLSASELTQSFLHRIATVDPALQAYTTLMPEDAMAQAKLADAELATGRVRSALHGVPIAVKDIIATRGVVTQCGMPVKRGWVPDHDATVVARLKDAGAIILGKTTTTEGAGMFHHPEMPVARNPWNPDIWPGVSSSGSGAAVAAGLCMGALGSDTGGSIRFPSAANGITGLKPSWGRVSRYGVFPLGESLDTVGPMARSAADCAAILSVIAGTDPLDVTTATDQVPDYLARLHRSTGIKGVRIGVDRAFMSKNGDPVVLALLAGAIETLRMVGAVIVEVAFPEPSELRPYIPQLAKLETALAHEALYLDHQSEYGSWLAQRIEGADRLDPIAIGRAIIARDRYKGQLAHLFTEIDALFAPVLVRPTPKVSEMLSDPQAEQSWMFTFGSIFNHARVPTLTLPCGFTPNGAPAGFQLIGPCLAEELLLSVGHAFQTVTEWHHRRPGIQQSVV